MVNFPTIAVIASLLFSANAGVLSGSKKPDVGINMAFSKTNPGKLVRNGQKMPNTLLVRLANQAGEQLVISAIHGQYYDLATSLPTKNTTNLPLRQIILPGLASPLIRYKFHSENKVGKTGLKVWIDYLDAGNKPHTALGFNDTVTIVEPKTSWFDIELIGLLLTAAVAIGFSLYFFLPTSKPIPVVEAPVIVAKAKAPVKKVEAVVSENGGEDDWVSKDIKEGIARATKRGQGSKRK